MADALPAPGGEPSASGDTAAATQSDKKKGGVANWSKTRMLYMLRLMNLSNGLLLIVTGILVFITGMVNISFASITVSGYVVFFGLLMTCLECQVGNLAPKFKRNFGFMFSFYGRTIFILFCSTMLFALNAWLGYLAGSLTAVNGIFNGYVICVHPSFKSGELSAKGDPFGGYTGGEKEMLSFLQRNPAIANKAAGAAVSFAKENPQVAMQIAGAASAPSAAAVAGADVNPWAAK